MQRGKPTHMPSHAQARRSSQAGLAPDQGRHGLVPGHGTSTEGHRRLITTLRRGLDPRLQCRADGRQTPIISCETLANARHRPACRDVDGPCFGFPSKAKGVPGSGCLFTIARNRPYLSSGYGIDGCGRSSGVETGVLLFHEPCIGGKCGERAGKGASGRKDTVFKDSGLKRPGSGRRLLQRDGQREANIGARAVRDTRPAMRGAKHQFLGYRIRLWETEDGCARFTTAEMC